MCEFHKPNTEKLLKPKEIESASLFLDQKSVHIRHNGETYRLIITRNNRLILQK